MAREFSLEKQLRSKFEATRARSAMLGTSKRIGTPFQAVTQARAPRRGEYLGRHYGFVPSKPQGESWIQRLLKPHGLPFGNVTGFMEKNLMPLEALERTIGGIGSFAKGVGKDIGAGLVAGAAGFSSALTAPYKQWRGLPEQMRTDIGVLRGQRPVSEMFKLRETQMKTPVGPAERYAYKQAETPGGALRFAGRQAMGAMDVGMGAGLGAGLVRGGAGFLTKQLGKGALKRLGVKKAATELAKRQAKRLTAKKAAKWLLPKPSAIPKGRILKAVTGKLGLPGKALYKAGRAAMYPWQTGIVKTLAGPGRAAIGVDWYMRARAKLGEAAGSKEMEKYFRKSKEYKLISEDSKWRSPIRWTMALATDVPFVTKLGKAIGSATRGTRGLMARINTRANYLTAVRGIKQEFGKTLKQLKFTKAEIDDMAGHILNPSDPMRAKIVGARKFTPTTGDVVRSLKEWKSWEGLSDTYKLKHWRVFRRMGGAVLKKLPSSTIDKLYRSKVLGKKLVPIRKVVTRKVPAGLKKVKVRVEAPVGKIKVRHKLITKIDNEIAQAKRVLKGAKGTERKLIQGSIDELVRTKDAKIAELIGRPTRGGKVTVYKQVPTYKIIRETKLTKVERTFVKPIDTVVTTKDPTRYAYHLEQFGVKVPKERNKIVRWIGKKISGWRDTKTGRLFFTKPETMEMSKEIRKLINSRVTKSFKGKQGEKIMGILNKELKAQQEATGISALFAPRTLEDLAGWNPFKRFGAFKDAVLKTGGTASDARRLYRMVTASYKDIARKYGIFSLKQWMKRSVLFQKMERLYQTARFNLRAFYHLMQYSETFAIGSLDASHMKGLNKLFAKREALRRVTGKLTKVQRYLLDEIGIGGFRAEAGLATPVFITQRRELLGRLKSTMVHFLDSFEDTAKATGILERYGKKSIWDIPMFKLMRRDILKSSDPYHTLSYYLNKYPKLKISKTGAYSFEGKQKGMNALMSKLLRDGLETAAFRAMPIQLYHMARTPFERMMHNVVFPTSYVKKVIGKGLRFTLGGKVARVWAINKVVGQYIETQKKMEEWAVDNPRWKLALQFTAIFDPFNADYPISPGSITPFWRATFNAFDKPYYRPGVSKKSTFKFMKYMLPAVREWGVKYPELFQALRNEPENSWLGTSFYLEGKKSKWEKTWEEHEEKEKKKAEQSLKELEKYEKARLEMAKRIKEKKR